MIDERAAASARRSGWAIGGTVAQPYALFTLSELRAEWQRQQGLAHSTSG
jgi:hypothetical protein